MNVSLLNRKIIVKSMSFLMLVIYIGFLYIDAANYNIGIVYSLHLKYSAIILCFIISLSIGSERIDKADKCLVQVARFFTVIADYFLVIKDSYKYGILCFCFVQIIYIARHYRMANMNIYKVFLTASLGIVYIISFLYKINPATFEMEYMTEGAVYGGILFTSLYLALKTRKCLIITGMTLFFLCDINVGLYNFTNEFIFGFLIWLFYLPSQLLLTLSGYKIEYIKQIFKG